MAALFCPTPGDNADSKRLLFSSMSLSSELEQREAHLEDSVRDLPEFAPRLDLPALGVQNPSN
jgi:hypothetical protein